MHGDSADKGHKTRAGSRDLGKGEEGLVPLRSLDPLETGTASELLAAMSQTAFSGRMLGEAAEVLEEMTRDPDCLVVATFSGAMTVAKMATVIVRMIDAGMIDCIVSTGALMAHGLSEAVGLTHYKHDPSMPDEELYEKGYNRVYDTLELEVNLNSIEEFLRSVLDRMDPSKPWSSEIICREIGRSLAAAGDSPGVLRSAFLKDVPVFVPAFTDSELGLDVATWMMRKRRASIPDQPKPDELFAGEPPPYNPFLDLLSYARLIGKKKKIGIFTIGGGVPRNWAQQVGPFYDIAGHRLGVEIPAPRFQYGVRICPEPVHWGGLSGCTYSEGVSWGKFVPRAEGGRYAEVYADATVVWPLLVRGVLERLGKV
jgi:deoxyhypusine synthase